MLNKEKSEQYKRLADDIKSEKDEIYVEADIKNGVYKLCVTGNVAWGVCFVALSAAIVAKIAMVATPPEPTTKTVEGVAFAASAGAAVSILGIPATTTAIGIGVAAGGAGILNNLKNNYEIGEDNADYLILKRKKSKRK